MGASADGIVHCACGKRHWGHAGAAGVLAWKEAEDPSVILQLRAAWSMSGGTWGIPGGAIDYDETP
ncbi:MAG: Maf family nucleotide pyrophosphatase, partial [Flaviflexus sp.]